VYKVATMPGNPRTALTTGSERATSTDVRDIAVPCQP
jgi:hypothetical protein